MLCPSMHRLLHQLRVSKRLISTFPAQVSKSFPERPVSVIFVSGEFLSDDMWTPWAKYLSNRGYCSHTIRLDEVIHDSSKESFYDVAEHLQETINNMRLLPPVLVTHASSCLVAEKFLESFPLSGLIMIDPIGPRPKTEVLQRLQSVISYTPRDSHNVRSSTTLYYSSPQSSSVLSTGALSHPIQESPEDFLKTKEFLVNNFSQYPEDDINVRLEPNAVPMLLIGDTSLIGNNLEELRATHGLHAEDCHNINGPWTDEEKDKAIQCIFEWIETYL